MKKITTILLTLVAIMSVQSARAWAERGHHIIAYIAEQHLTPEAKEKCQHYLRHSLPHYSSWQDYWRNSAPFKEITHWHMNYIDVNYKTVGSGGKITRDAVTQIERIVGEMSKGKYHKLSDSIITVNLKLLIHMVGDMHCPAHVAFPIEDKPTYDETTVYNRYRLKNKGKKYSYHALWDRVTDILYPKWKITEWRAAADTYNKKQRAKICRGDANDWLNGTAKEVVRSYKIIPRDTDIATLPDKKREELTELTYQQLAYAGYRLAYILNDIFKE